MLNFKDWFTFFENVIVDDNGKEAGLFPINQELITEFNYQFDNGYSTFQIMPYQAKKIGYVSVGTQATHIGITKTSPIEARTGVDLAFLNSLTNNLQSSGFKSIPFKEGESDWTHAFDQAPELKDKLKGEEEFQNSNVPSFQTGSSNVKKITPGISISKTSGSWSYFIKTSYGVDKTLINKILSAMKNAIEPLLEKDLVEFYEIKERISGKVLEIKYSPQGEENKNQQKNVYQNSVAYLKYLADIVLNSYPQAKKLILNRINGVGTIVSGGRQHPAANIEPKNLKIPFSELKKIVNQSYASDSILLFFLTAASTDKDQYYKILDAAASSKKPEIIDYAIMLLDDNLENIFDRVLDNLYKIIKILKNHEILEKLIPEKFNEFRSKSQKAIDELDYEELIPSDIKYLKELSNYLSFSKPALDAINQTHEKIEKKEKENQEAKKAAKEKTKHLLYQGTPKYIVLKEGKTVWEDIPERYVNYNGEINFGEFALEELIDREDVMSDAMEKATEEAYEDVPERPSLSYGEDKDEVNDDISYDLNDFIQDIDEEDLPEDTEELEELVKNKYYNDFVQWKIEKLKEKEEEESWKYEPEPDRSDVEKIAEEIAENLAFNDLGLVTLYYDNFNLEMHLSSKFKDKIKPILQKTLEINSKEKDESDESILKTHSKIDMWFVDKKQSEVHNAYDYLKNRD
jgi:hypothetical protein